MAAAARRERGVANPAQSLNPVPIMPRPPMGIRLVISASLAIAALSPAAAGAGGTSEEVTVDGPAGARLRVEAKEPHVLRLWMKASGGFTRQTSLALEAAADTHGALTRSED